MSTWKDIPSDPDKIPWNWWEAPPDAVTVDCECRRPPSEWKRWYWAFGTVRQLTRDEIAEAKEVGRIRHERSWARRRKDTVGPKTKENDLAKHQIGALGESAFGIFDLAGPWTKDIDTFHVKPDFMPDIEVRTAAQGYPNMWFRAGDLKIKDRRFVAQVIHPDNYVRIHAWAYGHELLRYPVTRIGQGPANRLVHIYDMHRFPFHEPKPVK